MNPQNSRQLVLALHDIWNSGNVDEIPNVYAVDCTVHWAKGWGPESRGHSQIKDAILHTRTVFPDWHEDVLDMVVPPDKVVTRYCSTTESILELHRPVEKSPLRRSRSIVSAKLG